MKKLREHLFVIVAIILVFSFPYWADPAWVDLIPISITAIFAGMVLILIGAGLVYGIRQNQQARKAQRDNNQDD